jgi:hypothetical protein
MPRYLGQCSVPDRLGDRFVIIVNISDASSLSAANSSSSMLSWSLFANPWKEKSSRARLVKNNRAKAARPFLTRARDALLDDTSSQVGINQPPLFRDEAQNPPRGPVLVS